MAWAIALLVLAIGSFTVAAQDASPTATDSHLATLGYPELRIVVTDDGFATPPEVAGGRYLVVLENQGTPGGSAAVTDIGFLQLPPGVTLDELNQAIFAEGAPIPNWFGEIVSTGGFSVDAGETGYGVLDLQPGEWVVGAGDTNPFVPFTVTGDPAATPTASTDPPADLTVELSDSGFNLPDQLPAGRQVWHATNVSGQHMEILLIKTPELATAEQVQALMGLPEGGTPPPGMPDPATFEYPTAGLQEMSPGREIWVELDLTPGNYVALSGGVFSIFMVGEPGTPTA